LNLIDVNISHNVDNGKEKNISVCEIFLESLNVRLQE